MAGGGGGGLRARYAHLPKGLKSSNPDFKKNNRNSNSRQYAIHSTRGAMQAGALNMHNINAPVRTGLRD